VLALFHQAKANDIVVSIATLTGQDVTAGANNAANFTFIQFDLNWSNSWRTSTGPLNWDAAWIFVKYQINGGTGCTPSNVWNHATLSPVSGNHLFLLTMACLRLQALLLMEPGFFFTEQVMAREILIGIR
jgi:hypothetical protein